MEQVKILRIILLLLKRLYYCPAVYSKSSREKLDSLDAEIKKFESELERELEELHG